MNTFGGSNSFIFLTILRISCSTALLSVSKPSRFVLKGRKFQKLLNLVNHSSLKFNLMSRSYGSLTLQCFCKLRAFSTMMSQLIILCRESWWKTHMNRACFNFELAPDHVLYFSKLLTAVWVVVAFFQSFRRQAIVDFPGVSWGQTDFYTINPFHGTLLAHAWVYSGWPSQWGSAFPL